MDVTSETFKFDCQKCGACCAYSDTWPELDESDDLPDSMVNYEMGLHGAMRCNGDRCTMIEGTIGKILKCKIYNKRPWACRTCDPKNNACLAARKHHNILP